MTPRSHVATPLRALAALAGVTLLAACSDGVTAPPQPAALEVAAGARQSAAVGSALATAPAVRVVDAAGRGVGGVEVAFSVLAGGGSVAAATAVTDRAGLATGAWTLGTTPGVNELRASAAGLGAVTFTAAAVPGAAAHVSARAGDGLAALAGSVTAEAPTVAVTDAYGNAVAGVSVRFAVRSGGGAVSSGSAVTDASGLASVGSWTLGQPGLNELTATVTGLPAVVFTATAQLEQTGGGYDIEVRYLSASTARQRQAVEAAVARWEGVIVGDLPDVRLQYDNVCGRSGLAVDQWVDDLLVYVDFDTIDGVGKILGQAGPCFIRGDGSKLPVAGIVILDGADLAAMQADGSLDDVVLHEIGHVLGIGTLWPTLSLLAGAGTSDPYFTGAEGRRAFASAGGSSYTGEHVPVENTGGAGTRDAHWRENVLGNELMTGFISASANPLSGLTVGSLADLGYTVAMNAADGFTVGAGGVHGYQAPGAEHVRELVERPLPFLPIPVPTGG
ncbi:MAG: leishmanolysin-related zinc metalloendopeptidase [Gemmatimonadota bacterium]